jgi:squalene-hopene/tetraprenyl-beta-curcumene cyclase
VPDADDTAGALLALRRLGRVPSSRAAAAGVRWLLDLQNPDGGWPTFCRGWGRLPFDRSSPDLTAHALRAIAAWHGVVDLARERRALSRALQFLRHSQLPDGSWLPLWFGSQRARDQANPVYGTSRVLTACAALGRTASPEAQRGLAFLTSVQNPDGGWGAESHLPSTVEETALATRALADSTRPSPVGAASLPDSLSPSAATPAALAGASFLAQRILQNGLAEPAPIGLYFSKLWYSERLYPLIWTVAALDSVLSSLEPRTALKAEPGP